MRSKVGKPRGLGVGLAGSGSGFVRLKDMRVTSGWCDLRREEGWAPVFPRWGLGSWGEILIP